MSQKSQKLVQELRIVRSALKETRAAIIETGVQFGIDMEPAAVDIGVLTGILDQNVLEDTGMNAADFLALALRISMHLHQTMVAMLDELGAQKVSGKSGSQNVENGDFDLVIELGKLVMLLSRSGAMIGFSQMLFLADSVFSFAEEGGGK